MLLISSIAPAADDRPRASLKPSGRAERAVEIERNHRQRAADASTTASGSRGAL
ncbi:hypothetical protein [Bradyrhizobium sp.]|uniref:hypothetical protein n=1 Tax=Bradyrhizobium sp. TaxID=376 RepID=UPI00391B8CF9